MDKKRGRGEKGRKEGRKYYPIYVYATTKGVGGRDDKAAAADAGCWHLSFMVLSAGGWGRRSKKEEGRLEEEGGER